MTTASFLKAFAATLATFLVLDAGWLYFVAIDSFQRTIGPVMQPNPNLMAAAPLYPIVAVALTLLAAVPARYEGVLGAVWRGGLLGLAAYATYDLTNLATIKGYTVSLAAMDIAWGTFLCAVSAVAGGAVLARGS